MQTLNHYTELLNYIKGLAEKDPLVNVVTQGYFDDIDLDKMTLYPLVHIQINSGGFTNGQTVRFNVTLGALTDRDSNNEEIGSKEFLSNTNEEDNYNEMFAVLNRIWTVMYQDFEDADITASADPDVEKVSDDYANGLDGWLITFDVEMPNNVMSLCQYL